MEVKAVDHNQGTVCESERYSVWLPSLQKKLNQDQPMQQQSPPTSPLLFCIHFTPLSNPLLQRYNSFSRLLMCVHAHVCACVCLRTVEKWPRCAMTPAEATAQTPWVAAGTATGWPMKYGHHFNRAAVCHKNAYR